MKKNPLFKSITRLGLGSSLLFVTGCVTGSPLYRMNKDQLDRDQLARPEVVDTTKENPNVDLSNRVLQAIKQNDMVSFQALISKNPALVNLMLEDDHIIYHMIRASFLEGIDYLFHRGDFQLSNDKHGNNVFQAAAKYGNLKAFLAVELLMRVTKGIHLSLTEKNQEGLTLLWQAVQSGNVGIVKYLVYEFIKQRADHQDIVQGQGSNEYTILHMVLSASTSSYQGKIDLLKSLLEDSLIAELINSQDHMGRTIIHALIEEASEITKELSVGPVEVIKWLLDSYPNIKLDIKDDEGETAIARAKRCIEEGKHHPESKKLKKVFASHLDVN